MGPDRFGGRWQRSTGLGGITSRAFAYDTNCVNASIQEWNLGRVSNVGQDLFIRNRGPLDALKLEFRIAHVASKTVRLRRRSSTQARSDFNKARVSARFRDSVRSEEDTS